MLDWRWVSETIIVNLLHSSLVFTGICTTKDVDMILTHMNNARYFREVDLARIDFYIRSRLFDVVRSQKGQILLGAANVRFRKFIGLFDRFKISTKITYWNEDSIFIEHRFIGKNGFVHATLLCQQRMVNCSGEVVMDILLKQGSTILPKPEMPMEVGKSKIYKDWSWLMSHFLFVKILLNFKFSNEFKTKVLWHHTCSSSINQSIIVRITIAQSSITSPQKPFSDCEIPRASRRLQNDAAEQQQRRLMAHGHALAKNVNIADAHAPETSDCELEQFVWNFFRSSCLSNDLWLEDFWSSSSIQLLHLIKLN